MKQLYIAVFILIFSCLTKNVQAQGIDSVKFSPDYICQIDSFSISMRLFFVSQPGRVDSTQQFFRNDTLHINGYSTSGPLASPILLKSTFKVKTPSTGKYIMNFKRYVNDGFGYILYGTKTDSFSVCMGTPLSIPESRSKNQLTAQIYPNPTYDFLTIQLPETKSQTVTATLTDVTGKKLLTQTLNSESQTHHLDIEKLPAGIYVLQLKSENSFKTVKILKQ